MAFEARLRIPGSTRLPLGVEVDITNERLVVTSGEKPLADWSLNELQVSSLPDGFHVKAGGEEVILNVTDSAGFAGQLGISQNDSRRRTSPESARRKYVRTAGDSSLDELESRVDGAAEALMSEEMSPPEAFALWLGLLKELNSMLGEGSLPEQAFHKLNARLLELIPEPEANPTSG
jgi:hypothetical protein